MILMLTVIGQSDILCWISRPSRKLRECSKIVWTSLDMFGNAWMSLETIGNLQKLPGHFRKSQSWWKENLKHLGQKKLGDYILKQFWFLMVDTRSLWCCDRRYLYSRLWTRFTMQLRFMWGNLFLMQMTWISF